MTDLLISRVAPGVARASTVDPFDSLVVHRIERSQWEYTPEEPGVYLLYGAGVGGKLTVYIGMSRTNMRSRIKSHHVNPAKNWFGVLFAVPIGSPLLCPAVEAELIAAVTEAGVVEVIDNKASESLHVGVDDVHIEPAVEKVRSALQLLLGSDIFTPSDDTSVIDPPVKHLTPLAREYRGSASQPRSRLADDPASATHVFAKAVVAAWGRFEADEPDKRFRVLGGSGWRPPVLNPDAVTYDSQVKVGELQKQLIQAGVLDESTHRFVKDHVFENWTVATRIVSGKSQYSGAYNWQRLLERSD
jgi:hypothetical protein